MSKSSKDTAASRAAFDLNLDAIAEERKKPKLTRKELDEAGAEAGFTNKPTTAAKKQTKQRRAQRERPWRRSGRTALVSTKIKPAANDLLMSLVSSFSEHEQRPISKAEVIERALALLHAQVTENPPT